MQAYLNRTVGELVAERPSRARVFERHGIDYCCGGKRTLADACARRELDADALGAELRAEEAAVRGDQRDWSAAPLAELIEHIVDTHHVYLRAELPRLEQLVEKVHRVHGPNHPELADVRSVYLGLQAELLSHMLKEEMVLFPIIRAMENGAAAGTGHCGSVNNPIRQMEHEHDSAGAALARLRELTSDFAVPDGACNTYRAMLDGLAELESDLHQHIHKENNILFPQAAALEQQQGVAGGAR